MAFNPKKYDSTHSKNVKGYLDKVRQAYLSIINEVAKLGSTISFDPNSEFYFKNYPSIDKKVSKLMDNLYNEVNLITINGINAEWDLANEKNADLVKSVLGKNFDKLPDDYRKLYLSTNSGVLDNFIKRKIDGLGLSDRIWNNTKQFRQELELSLELEIGQGTSASKIASRIKGYLNDTNKLFRRVRNAKGQLRLSKAAQSYNPGRGKYRSSYKNALRLTANETNFSYEGSQFEKRKQLDFIVGVQIKVSPQHSGLEDKGGVNCTALQGTYPKNFDWTYKWHVNCKCTSYNVLKTEEEIDEDTDLILEGKEPLKKSVNMVHKLPDDFTNFIKNNPKKVNTRTFENNKLK